MTEQLTVVEVISERFCTARLKMPTEQAARALVFSMRGLRETAADSRDMQKSHHFACRHLCSGDRALPPD